MTMSAASLLSLHVVLFGALAALLLVLPSLTLRALGLPSSGEPVWPRLTGALLAGIAIAVVAANQGWTRSGLGLGGLVAIDLVVAFTLVSALAFGTAAPTRRGRLFLWSLALVLALVGFVSIAIAT
jgi:hypothetical protein